MRYILCLLCITTQALLATPQFSGKTAFITGGSDGIGKAIVEAFAREGAEIIFTYNTHSQEAQDLAKKLSKPGQRIIPLKMNLLDEQSILTCLERVIQEFPKLDIVVNNAAILAPNSFLETNVAEFQQVLDANAKAPFFISQKLALNMIKEEVAGCIIHIGSIRGERPNPNSFNYSASKAILNTMTHMMAQELAPHRIRVNLIAPGATLTPMTRTVHNSEEKLRKRAERIPLKRHGKPEEQAFMALYLASDAACWITGSIIAVDGGESTIY